MNTATRPAPETTASIWTALWSEFIAAKRAGHVSKAAEAKARMVEFDKALG
jgi:fructosamine-3-kinase